jgi:hypothetical protein
MMCGFLCILPIVVHLNRHIAKYMIDNPSSIVFSNLDTQILRVMWFGLTPKSDIGIRHVFKNIIDLMFNHDDHSKLDS